jgi:hypothetical protein
VALAGAGGGGRGDILTDLTLGPGEVCDDYLADGAGPRKPANSINLLAVALDPSAPTAHFISTHPETITDQPSSPASTTLSLKGKIALVTGAAAGLGKRIAEAYADAGGNVVIADRSWPTRRPPPTPLRRKASRPWPSTMDVTDEAAVDAGFGAGKRRWARWTSWSATPASRSSRRSRTSSSPTGRS